MTGPGAASAAAIVLVQLVVTLQRENAEAERSGDLAEIREGDVALGPAADLDAVEEVAVRLEDRDVAAVVEQEDLHRQAVAGDRLQLLHVHHDAAVAGERDDPPLVVARGADADRGRQVVAHRRAARIAPVPLAFLERAGLESDDAGGAHCR